MSATRLTLGLPTITILLASKTFSHNFRRMRPSLCEKIHVMNHVTVNVQYYASKLSTSYTQMSHLSTKSWRSSLLLKSSSMMQGFNVSVKILLLQTKFCTLINQSYKEHHIRSICHKEKEKETILYRWQHTSFPGRLTR